MSNRYQSWGFDLDGTLYQRDASIDRQIQKQLIHKVAEKLGREVDEVKREFYILYNQNNSGSTTLRELGIENPKKTVRETVEQTKINLPKNPALVNEMNRLHGNKHTFLITSSSVDSAAYKLDSLGLNIEDFNHCLTGESTIYRNNGAAFEYMRTQSGIGFDQTIFFGDRRDVDILPAKKLGIYTVAVHTKIAEADEQLDSIHGLNELIGRLER